MYGPPKSGIGLRVSSVEFLHTTGVAIATLKVLNVVGRSSAASGSAGMVAALAVLPTSNAIKEVSTATVLC